MDKLNIKHSQPLTNCAINVAERVLRSFDIDDKDVTSNLLFGFDLINDYSPCGAISGGILAINRILIQKGASNEDLKFTIKQFMDQFQSKYGGITCKELKTRLGTEHTSCLQILEDSTIDIKEIINYVRDVTNPFFDKQHIRR